MAHSLRRPNHEPPGSFTNTFGTKFTVYSNGSGTWQRTETSNESADYRVDYVIGSGSHALGYLVRIGDHLFQSPIGYYPSRRAYAMAPGYENLADADFTRPVTEECLRCHSGNALHIPGTIAGYRTPAFSEQTISCERCHGPTEEHLKRPVQGSIVNPAKLSGPARDSICEQCHLSGITRIPNPGKTIADFRPGMPLEEVYSVYAPATPSTATLRVVSHAEQLRSSVCARMSAGKLWCGTCHDLHNKPASPSAYYRSRCLSCHTGKLSAAHPPQALDCISCHMTRRPTSDGAHTVFTDHRISRRPPANDSLQSNLAQSDLVAWREPDAQFAARNLAIAYVVAGSEIKSVPWLLKGYRMLTEVQTQFAADPAVFKAIGVALLEGNQAQEAKIAFDRVLELDPNDALNQENAGRADFAFGNIELAAKHFEKALELDPLLLSSAGLLEEIYRKQNQPERESALAERMRRAMSGK